MTQANRFDKNDYFTSSLYTLDKTNGVDYAEFTGLYRTFNQTICDICAKEKVLLIDLDKDIPKTKEYLYDTVHFNGRGSSRAAEIIADALIRHRSGHKFF